MPKTTFVRKPITLEDVRIGARQIESLQGGVPTDNYYVAKEVQMGANDFFELHEDLFSDREWIQEFSNQEHPMKDGAVAAIRVTCKGSLTVLIIDPQGSSYPRYVGLEAT